MARDRKPKVYTRYVHRIICWEFRPNKPSMQTYLHALARTCTHSFARTLHALVRSLPARLIYVLRFHSPCHRQRTVGWREQVGRISEVLVHLDLDSVEFLEDWSRHICTQKKFILIHAACSSMTQRQMTQHVALIFLNIDAHALHLNFRHIPDPVRTHAVKLGRSRPRNQR